MKIFKVKIDYIILSILFTIAVFFLLLDITDVIDNSFILSIILFYLIISAFFKYYTRQVYQISFVNDDKILIKKFNYFKRTEFSINIENMQYCIKTKISYPNKFYELFFVTDNIKIQVNNSNNFIAFTIKDINEIIKHLGSLNVKESEL